MITRVQVRNYRSIADIDVTLGPLTVLVGRNGAGKSTFVDVLRFVRDALTVGLDTAFVRRSGLNGILRSFPDTEPFFEIRLTMERVYGVFGAEYGFRMDAGPNSGSYRVAWEQCRLSDGNGGYIQEFRAESGKRFPTLRGWSLSGTPEMDSRSLILPALSSLSAPLRSVRNALSGNYYRLYPDVLRQPQPESGEFILSDDGRNLATAILYKRTLQPEAIASIVSGMRHLLPDVVDIDAQQLDVYSIVNIKYAATNDSSNKTGFYSRGLAHESDGTVRLLGILTALADADSRGIPLSLEEPEDSLHPGALGILADAIRETATRRQVIITTQSPDLISRFNADELRIVERVNGVTEIGPIDETQRSVIDEQLFSAGDLLRIEGLRREPVVVGSDTSESEG